MKFDWEEYSLSDIAELTGGYAFKSNQYMGNGVFVLRTLNIDDEGYMSMDDSVYVSNFDAEKFEKFKLFEKDILFVMVGATLGKVGRVTKNVLPALLNQNMWCIRAKNNLVDQDFLYYSFKQNVTQIIGWASGSARGFLRRDDCRNLKIKIPPLKEQKAIAHILRTLDDRIALNRERNEILEGIAQSLFKSWFIDFDPVKAKEEGRSTGLSDDISELFPDSFEDSELGEIPKGWQVKELDEVADLSGGYAFKSKDYTTKGSFIVRTLNIGEDSFINKKDAVFIEQDKFDEFRKFELLEGDTLFVMVGATLGKIGLVSSDIVPSLLNQNMWRIRSKNNSIGQMFIYYSFSNKVKEITSWVSGSARGFLRREDCRKLKIIMPPEKICDRYEKIASLSFKKRTSNIVSNMLLVEIRDTLLPRLVSGELRIPDSEKMIEEVSVQ